MYLTEKIYFKKSQTDRGVDINMESLLVKQSVLMELNLKQKFCSTEHI